MPRPETFARCAELTELPASGDPQLVVDVAHVLRRLSPEHRAILVLRYLEGIDEQHAARLRFLAPATRSIRARIGASAVIRFTQRVDARRHGPPMRPPTDHRPDAVR